MAFIPGTNPFEVFWLVACILLSIVYVFGSPAPSSVSKLPIWVVVVWYCNLGLGSAMGLIGGLVKRDLNRNSSIRRGLIFYAAGWGYVGTASVVYGLLILIPTKTIAVSGVMTLFWGLASLYRVRQVYRLFAAQKPGAHRV